MATISISLDTPLPITQQTETTTNASALTVDWILVMPTQRELRIKILELNREVQLSGTDYDAVIGSVDRNALLAAARSKVLAALSPA